MNPTAYELNCIFTESVIELSGPLFPADCSVQGELILEFTNCCIEVTLLTLFSLLTPLDPLTLRTPLTLLILLTLLTWRIV